MHNSHVSVESLVNYCPHGPARWSHPLSVPRLCLSRSLSLSLLSSRSSLLLYPPSLYSILSPSSFSSLSSHLLLSLVCLSLSFFYFFFVFNSLISLPPPPLSSCRSESLCLVVNRTGYLNLTLSLSSSSSNNSTILICLSLIYHFCLILLLLSPAWRTRCPYLPILHSARKRLGSLAKSLRLPTNSCACLPPR